MIEGPCSGAISESDNASAADVAALTGVFATKSAQLASLTNSVNNIPNSFYVKSQVDALLSGKQAVVGDGDLTIARTSGLQTALDGKQNSLSNNGGGGIPMLNGASLRQVSAVAPLSATILYDFANPSDPNNNNVELSVDLSG